MRNGKMKKKVLLSLVLFAACVSFASADSVYYTDGFETYDVGFDPEQNSIKDSGNWTFTNNQTDGVVDTKAYSGNQSFVFDSSVASIGMTTSKVPTGEGVTSVVINTKVWLGDIDSGDNFTFRISGENSSSVMAGRIELDCYGSNNVYLKEWTGGTQTPTGNGEKFSDGILLSKWLDITLEIDKEAETWSYSIVDTTDSSVLASGSDIAYYAAADDITRVRFYVAHCSTITTNDRDIYIDDVVIASVPEPMTLSLIAVGVAGLACRRRKSSV